MTFDKIQDGIQPLLKTTIAIFNEVVLACGL